MLHELDEDLEGLSADSRCTACDKRRDARDADPARLHPVGIDGILESSLFENFTRVVSVETCRVSAIEQHIRVRDVQGVNEVGLVKNIVDRFAFRLCVCPFAKLLRQAAVVSVRAGAVWQAFYRHQFRHLLLLRGDCFWARAEKLLQRASLSGRFGMQGKVHEFDADVVDFSDVFSTHGTEIAPRSHVVREDFEQ